MDLFGTLLFLFPLCGFLIWSSWDYVAASWELGESSREAGGLPWVYLLKATIILMPALLILQGTAEAARSVLVIGGQTLPQDDNHSQAEV